VGANFQAIVDVEATAEEADELADATLAWLVGTGVVSAADQVSRNEVSTAQGLEILTGRNVFYSLTGEQWLTCAHCDWTTDPGHTRIGDHVGEWAELTDTIGRWYDGGSGDLSCPNCDRAASLNDWHWSPPWGFGCFGLRFWHWPTLSPAFLAEVSARLGHRTVYPYGKL